MKPSPIKAVSEPAFPTHHTDSNKGMSLRDYFAAKAMQGMIYGSVKAYENPSMCAEWAYQTADAMLKERENK